MNKCGHLILNLRNSPYWNILKDVGYADEASRLNLFDINQFNKKMEYVESLLKGSKWLQYLAYIIIS